MLKKIPFIILITAAAVSLSAQPVTPPGSDSGLSENTGGPLAESLTGKWKWNNDEEEYDGGGNGIYWRNGNICYKFTYSISGDIVNTVADRDHTCGAKRVNDWKISVRGKTMYKQHTGSGYRTEWHNISSGSPLAEDIKGKWKWNSDEVEYDGGGNGIYWRNGNICYKFTYSVSGDIVNTVADRDHNCGAKKVNDWKISVKGNTLYKQHTGSGYQTEWKLVNR
ncbi:MAG TPA: hypothetical protein PK358_17520 [Spirochaetota bacterium]|nr:hypothetical protein [Spirochaetota bacterium]HPJ36640.1 hypothetical protein [Spirochaetota bacterium]